MAVVDSEDSINLIYFFSVDVECICWYYSLSMFFSLDLCLCPVNVK